MKLFRKSNLFTTSIMMILMFSTVLLVSCEEEVFNNQLDYLEIEGDLNNPETFFDGQNTEIFIEASSRMRKNLQLKNNQLVLSINSGSSIGVSEKLFKYIENNYQLTNQKLLEKKRFAYVDDKKNIRVVSHLASSDNIVRLKSGSIESGDDKTNLNGMSAQDILENLYEFAHSGNGGSLNDYYYLDSINWNTNSIGSAYIQGTGTINGRQAMYTLQNGCYYSGDNNCDFNDIGSYNGNSSYDWVRNIDGLPIVSIWYY